jgi:hypothetical protein
VGRGLGPWAGPARPEIQTGRAGPKFKQYGPFRAWAGPGRAARMYTYTIGGYLLGRLTTFYPSIIPRATCNMPSTVGGTHRAPSTLRVTDDTETRQGVGRSMTGTTASRPEVTPPELSRLWPQLVARSGDGQDDTSSTPLLGTDTMNTDKKAHVGSLHSLCVSGPFSGPLTSKSPTSTSTSLSRTRGGWLAIYTTAARAAGATEDVMPTYLPIVLGQDAL